jgi:Phospholipase_D-nuclease N-terminal
MTRTASSAATVRAVAPLGLSVFTAGLTVAGVIAVVLGVAACISVLSNTELSGGAKAMWVVIIAFVPIIGSAIYFGVRSDW